MSNLNSKKGCVENQILQGKIINSKNIPNCLYVATLEKFCDQDSFQSLFWNKKWKSFVLTIKEIPVYYSLNTAVKLMHLLYINSLSKLRWKILWNKKLKPFKCPKVIIKEIPQLIYLETTCQLFTMRDFFFLFDFF